MIGSPNKVPAFLPRKRRCLERFPMVPLPECKTLTIALGITVISLTGNVTPVTEPRRLFALYYAAVRPCCRGKRHGTHPKWACSDILGRGSIWLPGG